MATMTTEERISKIANKRVQLDNESIAENQQRVNTICNLTDRIKACQPRIAALMKVCAALCENKISIGKKIYRLGGYDEEFIAEGFFHKIGFYFVRFNRSNYLRGIGIRGGGACGNDFAVDERGFIFENPIERNCGRWTNDNAYRDFKDKAEKFINDFDAFEKAVYDYVDNL
jgi:hypothetical protein